LVAAASLAFSITPPATAESTDATQNAIFAVLTHKGGFAAGKAHDHLVAAGSPTITLEWDASDPLATRFELRAQVTSLRVDEDPLRSELFPRLRDLGLLQQPFGPLTDAQRAEIREAMLSKKQLDAAAFPELSARLVEVSASASKLGSVDFTHRGTVELTVHGTTIRRPFQARFDAAAGSPPAILEAVGEATFTELGIKPYSAFLGAVKNLDRFHFYLRLELEADAD
jgi:hypothetical protein